MSYHYHNYNISKLNSSNSNNPNIHFHLKNAWEASSNLCKKIWRKMGRSSKCLVLTGKVIEVMVIRHFPLQQNYQSLVVYSVQRQSTLVAESSHPELFLRIISPTFSKVIGLNILNQSIRIQNKVKLSQDMLS